MDPNAGKPWFSTAFDEVDKVVAQQKLKREVGIRFNLRFFRDTNKGEEAKIVFLDPDNMKDVPGFWEHEYDTLDGSWWNHTLCPKPSPCLMCERRVAGYFGGAFSVIRLGTVRDSQGREYTNQRQLLVAKAESLQRLRRMYELREGLVGTVWSVSRTSPRAAKIGDDWQFMEKIAGGRQGIATKLGLTMDKVAPYNYVDVLKVKTREELMSEPIDWSKSTEKFNDRGGPGGGGGGGQGGYPPPPPPPPQGSRGTEVPYGQGQTGR